MLVNVIRPSAKNPQRPHAHRHLERQFDQAADRQPDRLAHRAVAGRRLPAGDQDASTRPSRASRSRRWATTSPCTARRPSTASRSCPSSSSTRSPRGCPATTPTTMPASSRRRSRPSPARCGSRRSICPTATRRTPRNIHTRSNGWIGFSTTHMNGLQLEEPLILAGDYNVIPAAADVHNPAAWVNDALFLPQTREKFRALDQSRPDRRGPRRQRRARALHVLGLSGRRLAEEQGHPHRPPAAVAAGRRPADHRRHRQARALLGEAVRPRAGVCRSGDRADVARRFSRVRGPTAARLLAAAFDPALEQDQRERALVVASPACTAVSCSSAIHGSLRARPVAGEGQPHQARRALARRRARP